VDVFFLKYGVAQIVTDQSFDQWPSAGCLTNRHSDIVSTHQHLAQSFIRLATVALWRFCNLRSKVWNVSKSQLCWDFSGVSR